MQPGRSHDYRLCRRVDGTHIEQPSTNIDLERQTAHGARHSGRDQGNRPGCSRVRPGGPNATVEASGKQRTGATAVDMKLEIVAVPVTGMAPRCRLRHRPGFPGDRDEPRLGLAIIFGTGITSDAPGSA